VFAPLATKPQAATSSPAHRRASLAQSRFEHRPESPVEAADGRPSSLEGPGRFSRPPIRGADFAKILVYPPGRADAATPSPSPWWDKAIPLQAKLRIGAVDDPLEREADRVADRITRMPASCPVTPAPPRISRKCAACAAEDNRHHAKPPGSASAAGGWPAAVQEVLRSPGRPLDSADRAFFEPRFGHDFSRVRVHRGPAAEQSAQAVNARAYTVGQSIVLGPDAQAMSAEERRHLLAHELTHVVQQTGASSANPTLARQPAEAEPAPIEEPEERVETKPQEEYRTGNVDFTRTPVNQNAPPREMLPGSDWRPDPDAEIQNLSSPFNEFQIAEGSTWKDRQVKAIWFRSGLESRPSATLERGGAPPDFVTISPKSKFYAISREEATVWPELANARIEYHPRDFHILDAMDHDFDLSTSPEEDLGLFLSYFPDPKSPIRPSMPGQLPQFYRAPDGRYVQPRLPRGATIGRFFLDFDDQTTLDARSAELGAILARRRARQRQQAQEQALAEAEKAVLKGKKRVQGACTEKRTRPRGGNEDHDRYASHVAAEQGYPKLKGKQTELTVTTPEGVSYAFDTFNPDPTPPRQVWEVKTMHEWTSPTGMAEAPYRVREFSKRITSLEIQRLTGLYVAARCGLRFTYAVDNCEAAQGLRQQWALPPVYYIPFPGELRVPCP
jgi:hypothetical protein